MRAVKKGAFTYCDYKLMLSTSPGCRSVTRIIRREIPVPWQLVGKGSSLEKSLVSRNFHRFCLEPYQVEVDVLGGKKNLHKNKSSTPGCWSFSSTTAKTVGFVFVGDFFTDWDPMGWKSLWKTTMRENIFGSLLPNHQIQGKNAMFPHQTSPSKSKCYAFFFRSISTGGGNFQEMFVRFTPIWGKDCFIEWCLFTGVETTNTRLAKVNASLIFVFPRS